MARGEGRVDDLFCAAHAGEIPGFSRLSVRIPSIDHYEEIFRRDVRNLGRAAKIAGIAAGGGLVLAPAAFAAAPALGGALGTAYGLAGIAAVNKGLATLGLGALSTGGFGVAGGTAVITATGATVGSAVGGVVANAYWGDVRGFKIVPLKEGRGPAVLTVNGFLTDDDRAQERLWLNTLGKYYSGNPWYLVEWESKRLRDLASTAAQGLGTLGGGAVLKNFASRATVAAPSVIISAQLASILSSLAKNPWQIARLKAAQTGALLGEILARTSGRRKYILLGHSLGAAVLFHALRTLAGKSRPRVKTAHLLGGAIGTGKAREWEEASSAVEGGLHNYYSKRDGVLGRLYTTARAFFGTPPIGRNPIRCTAGNLENHDVTPYVSSHGQFKEASVQFLVV